MFRFVLFAGLVAAMVLGAIYWRCGSGFGLGGGSGVGVGGSGGPARPQPALGSGSGASEGVKHCQLRVSSAGIALDGASATLEAAVAACKRAAAADVTVTGDARQGTWDQLQRALDAAGVATFVSKPRPAPPPSPTATPAAGPR